MSNEKSSEPFYHQRSTPYGNNYVPMHLQSKQKKIKMDWHGNTVNLNNIKSLSLTSSNFDKDLTYRYK